MNLYDIVGKKFGRLTVIKRTGKNRFGHSVWECLCDCGKSTLVMGLHLKNGNTQSCGCLHKERTRIKNTGKMKTTAPSTHPNIKDIYWAAGIYEGEGYCTFGGTAAVRLTQKDTWILYKLQSLFGGYVRSRNTGKNFNYWSLSGVRARGLLMTIYTILSPWRQQQARRTLLNSILRSQRA